MINGEIYKNTTLTANTEEIIEFPKGVQNLSLALLGTATLAYKVNKAITIISDSSANILNSSFLATDIFKNYGIKELHVMADSNVQIQWDSPQI